MPATEERIQEALNEAGCIASREALRDFDTDGSPIQIGPEIWRTKGQQPKCYQTPHGEIRWSATSGGRGDLLSAGARCADRDHVHTPVCQADEQQIGPGGGARGAAGLG